MFVLFYYHRKFHRIIIIFLRFYHQRSDKLHSPKRMERCTFEHTCKGNKSMRGCKLYKIHVYKYPGVRKHSKIHNTVYEKSMEYDNPR